MNLRAENAASTNCVVPNMQLSLQYKSESCGNSLVANFSKGREIVLERFSPKQDANSF